MVIVRQPLPGDLQSSYDEVTDVILIDPAKVPPDGEEAIIQHTLLVLAGYEDLAPYTRRAPTGRRLYAVPDHPARADGVG